MNNYYGLPVVSIESKSLRITCLADSGPRIVGLFRKSDPQFNLLAETPDISWPTPYGEFFIRGGHRVWTSPELPETCSIPDAPVTCTETKTGLLIQAEPNAIGISKQFRIELDPEQEQITIQHTIRNNGSSPLTFAPWAITQMALGGKAFMPWLSSSDTAMDKLPNRNLVFWPYSDWKDERLHISQSRVMVDASSPLPPFKIGSYAQSGWLGYAIRDTLFVKTFPAEAETGYPDLNCSAQIYMNEFFLEMESLGTLAPVAPGEKREHVETWSLYDHNSDDIPEEVVQVISN